MDLRSRRIPNGFVVALLLLGLGFGAWSGGVRGILLGLAGAALGLGILIVPFAMRLVPGGDVKFLAATGAWLGPLGVVVAAVAGFALSGLLVLYLVLRNPELARAARTNLATILLSREFHAVEDRPAHLAVPLATALAGGGFVALFLGWGP